MKRNQMTKTTAASTPFTRKKIVTALLALQPMIVMLYGPPAHAQLTPDANAAQQPGIAAAANGVPVLNITGPNAAGVSHNVFTDYNVGKTGLIVNNSNAAVDTQLGGRIAGNSQLGATPAQVILNEVTGSSPSLLNGSTEIAGQAAHLIVANPNGITANGAGFINASRVTLSTGKPVFDSDGYVTALDVTQGHILIEGDGLDARGSDRLDLVSRSLKLNAALHAKQLTVMTGVGRYDVEHNSYGKLQAPAGAATAQGDTPAVAIDVAQLGGMYADSIYLVARKAGVGVNVAGKLQSLAGDIVISSAGDVVFAAGSSVASIGGMLSTQSKLLSNAGKIVAQYGVHTSYGLVSNDGGSISSDADMRIGGTLDNTNGNIDARYITVFGKLDNKNGNIDARYIGADEVDNKNGSIHIRVGDVNDWAYEGSGILQTKKLDNTNGVMVTEHAYVDEIVNQGGHMEVNGQVGSYLDWAL
ncbi:filamentous hemagglutinin N-terminal domain-containing protein [Paraherbaspirillum soli]|uniref:Filamentous hemagglutinin N-terminal domain-containing protein n=1 Tax=Paraherbaspirillum soli TaxID=631222 RepID=A0ABW0MBX2_9BURK